MPQNQRTFVRFAPLILILGAWCAVNGKLFSVYGVKVVSDSPRYIEYANGLASGFYIDTFNIWYIGYVLYLLVVFKVFAAGITGAIVGQYVLSFLSVVALYRTTFLLSRSTVSAVVASLLFVAFPDISQWNSYILTESLYISFTCFSFYFLVVYQQNTTTKNLAIASLF
ncbi:MAG: hypothetical protein WDO14_00195 [Bacteroidota bacterium]